MELNHFILVYDRECEDHVVAFRWIDFETVFHDFKKSFMDIVATRLSRPGEKMEIEDFGHTFENIKNALETSGVYNFDIIRIRYLTIED